MTRPDRLMAAYPTLKSGRFAAIADFEDPRQMELVQLVSVSREAMQAFDAERMEAAKKTVWATGCSSWYLDAEGIPASWPWTYQRFKDEMSAPQLEALRTHLLSVKKWPESFSDA